MKRFLLTAVLITVLIGVMLYFTPKSIGADVISYADCDAVVNIYCRNAYCDSIDLGLGRQVTCSVSGFNEALLNCGGVDGVSVSFRGNAQDVANVVNRLQAVTVNCQQLDGLYVACCYSPRLRGGITLDGERVNFQVALSDGIVTVGYPIILGSY